MRLGNLRQMIKEARRKKGRGIKLVRVGGLSPIRQAKGTAPENKGVWAFIWPYVEPFLLGSTGPEGVHPGEGKTRYDQMKREGLRRFVHKGVLYTRINVPGSVEINGWFKTDSSTLEAFMKKHFANTTKAMRQHHNVDINLQGMNPWSLYSKDEFEVFVPEPSEEGF